MAEADTLLHRLFGPSPRILILRGARLGDFLSTTPAFRAIRQALPRARIGLITSPGLVELARRYTWFDDIFVAPGWPGVSDGPEGDEARRRFFATMRRWRADVALQLQGGGESSNLLVRRLGARFTAGVRHPRAPDLDLTVPYLRTQSVRLRYLDLLALLDIPALSSDLELPRRPGDDAELAAALPPDLTLADLGETALLGIHAAARSGARQWPVDRFAVVATRLCSEFGLRAVVLGSERESGRALSELMPASVRPIDLTGRTSLGALVALIGRLEVFLGNDSGPSHVAEALGTPSVVVYGASHPMNWAPPAQAWHRVVADWTAPCRWFRPCGCPDDSSAPCLQGVTVDQVYEEARLLLDCLRRRRCLQKLR